MRKFILLCLLVFTVSSVVFAQQMTDEQVILYVQEAQSQGKTQQEMLVELMKKGVTKEQIPRISLRMNQAWIISDPKSKVLKGCGRNRLSNATDMERG